MTNPSIEKAELKDVEVAIIGSGFGGLCMAIKLKEAGIESFAILEKDSMFGGTWRANHYPGAACDVPSHLYSFSFAQNARWSRKFPSQPELWAYTQDVVAKYKLAPHIHLETALVSADFDDSAGVWRVVTSKGAFTAKCVVSATGALSRPTIPKVPGLASFKGKMFHSADWDHDYELAGKRVAVIGTGASAIQFVPEIAPQVAQLDLYQRTAPWVMYDNLPTETKYIYTDDDSQGKQLNGQNLYSITFQKGQVPPVKGFWSVTLYNELHFFNTNALKRYSLGTKNKTIKYNADGSLTLYAGAKSPGKDKESNWLPAPNGTFSLYIRAYWSEQAVLDGAWLPPKIDKAK